MKLTTPLLLILLPLLVCAVGYLLWLWAKRIVAREKVAAVEEEERRREEMASRPRLPSLHNEMEGGLPSLEPTHHWQPPHPHQHQPATAHQRQQWLYQEEEDPPPSYEEATKTNADGN